MDIIDEMRPKEVDLWFRDNKDFKVEKTDETLILTSGRTSLYFYKYKKGDIYRYDGWSGDVSDFRLEGKYEDN